MCVGVSWICAKSRLERSAARSDERVRVVGPLRSGRRGHHVSREVSPTQSELADQISRQRKRRLPRYARSANFVNFPFVQFQMCKKKNKKNEVYITLRRYRMRVIQ